MKWYWWLGILVLIFVILATLSLNTCFGCDKRNLNLAIENAFQPRATAEQPFIVDRNVKVREGEASVLHVGFYNQKRGTIRVVFATAKEVSLMCMHSNGQEVEVTLKSPEPLEVGVVESINIQLVLLVEDAPEGTAICSLSAFDADIMDVLYTTQFYVEIVTD